MSESVFKFLSFKLLSVQLFISWFLVFAVFCSLFSFVFIFFFGSWFGDKGVSIFCIFLTFVSWFSVFLYIIFMFVFYFIFDLPLYSFVEFSFGSWFSIPGFTLYWGFYFDLIAVIMLFVVLFITFVVQVYCLDYMWGDPFFLNFTRIWRCFLFLCCFWLVLVIICKFFLDGKVLG